MGKKHSSRGYKKVQGKGKDVQMEEPEEVSQFIDDKAAYGSKLVAHHKAREREDTSMESRMFSMLESISTLLDSFASQTETRLYTIEGKMDGVDARVNLLDHGIRLVMNEAQWAMELMNEKRESN
ncbi:hypothetical protein ACH5RR_026742 [Cinchona calisaya]|uniref:Uncharacterized protein n=1 Tax=Cinchona calisaya TaxID=153742 RepID=A0ABD2Z3G4_9GENT